ncbi:MAG: hypothetical protein U0271_40885 [Polyangiaceae bacterium]
MKRSNLIKLAMGLVAFAASFVFMSVGSTREAHAGVVSLTVKAEVAVPYVIVTPPRPIVEPRRVTVHVVRDGHRYVRLVGYRPHRVLVVHEHAPVYVYRARFVDHVDVRPRVKVIRTIDHPRVTVVAGRPHVVVRHPRPHVDVRVGGPHVKVGGPHVKVRGPHVKVKGPHVSGPKVKVGGSVKVKVRH